MMSKTGYIKMIHVPFRIHKLVSIVSKNVHSRCVFIKQHVVLQWLFLGHNLLMLIKRTVREAWVSLDNPHGFPVQEGIGRWG